MHDLLLDAGIVVGWLALFVGAICTLAYLRASLAVGTAVLLVLLGGYWAAGLALVWWKVTVSVPFVVLLFLNIRPLRIRILTRPFMKKLIGTCGARCTPTPYWAMSMNWPSPVRRLCRSASSTAKAAM